MLSSTKETIYCVFCVIAFEEGVKARNSGIFIAQEKINA
jgi:hypothetical protein